MEKELVELFERVKKAADAAAAVGGTDSSTEEDRCLEALNRLKGLPINYDVLVSTQLQKVLKQISQNQDSLTLDTYAVCMGFEGRYG